MINLTRSRAPKVPRAPFNDLKPGDTFFFVDTWNPDEIYIRTDLERYSVALRGGTTVTTYGAALVVRVAIEGTSSYD